MKQVVAICLGVMLLVTSLSYVAFSFTGQPALYTDDWPATATYVIKTDGTNIWAVGANGKVDYSGTNASALIQDTIDALPASGGSIFIKVGLYSITNTITFPKNKIILVQGETAAYDQSFTGQNGTILLADGLDGDLFTSDSSGFSFISLENLNIFGNDAFLGGSHTNGDLVHFYNPQETRIWNNEIKKSAQDGIHLDSGGGYDGDQNSIFHNRIEHNAEYGIYLGNVGHGTSIISNHLEHNGYSGILLATTCADVTISANMIIANDQYGIYIGGSENRVIGNTVYLQGRAGIFLAGTARITIAGNNIRVNGQTDVDPYGIWLYNTSNSTITGDIITDTVTTKHQNWGIYESGTSDYNIIIGVSALGDTPGTDSGIYAVGTNTEVHLSYNGTTWVP